MRKSPWDRFRPERSLSWTSGDIASEDIEARDGKIQSSRRTEPKRPHEIKTPDDFDIQPQGLFAVRAGDGASRALAGLGRLELIVLLRIEWECGVKLLWPRPKATDYWALCVVWKRVGSRFLSEIRACHASLIAVAPAEISGVFSVASRRTRPRRPHIPAVQLGMVSCFGSNISMKD